MSRPRILIVDDDEQVCFVASRALESLGVCESVPDVTSATRALARQPFDLVLVDVTLPGPSGLVLLDHLRQNWPHSAAVMLSGLTELSVARDALARGALGYVVKPFRVADLRIQATAALSRVRRSVSDTRASIRARLLAQIGGTLHQSDSSACVVVDIEHISLLQATYGSEAIDRLCQIVEQRFRNLDLAIGGVEQLAPGVFGACVGLPAKPVGAAVARQVHRGLAAPIVVDGQRIPIAVSLGLAVASPGEPADSILSLAESAAEAARDGCLPFVVYDGDLRDSARLQLELLADAADAIHRGDLHVAYQTQHDLRTGNCVGIEALARWRHPTRGDIPPSVFVPLAERMDLIGEVGNLVLHAACDDLAGLRRARGSSVLRVSVNVSTTELRDSGYPDRVAEILMKTALPPSALRLEITESVLLDESDEVCRALADLQLLGIELSVDDFGTGYASFASLARLPWSEIKLDRSLTTQCRDRRGREVLRAILSFGATLDIDVIAEGIETHAELDALRELGCRYGQGFLLGVPVAISDLPRRLSVAAA